MKLCAAHALDLVQLRAPALPQHGHDPAAVDRHLARRAHAVAAAAI